MPNAERRTAITADGFYFVAKSIRNKDWKEFVGSKLFLNFLKHEINVIEYNETRSIKEQKCQMLLKWQQMLGSRATLQYLKQLHDAFLRNDTNNGSAVNAVTSDPALPPSNNNRGHPSASIAPSVLLIGGNHVQAFLY